MIRLLLANLPIILFVLAFVIAFARRHPPQLAARLLAWLLLLSVGVEETWAGFFHVAFPQVAAASIGWDVSPFQFEIGVADLAVGITAIVSFRRGLDFKAAVVWYVALFYAGVAIGHVREAVETGNFSINNFGPLLAITLVKAVLLPWLLITARRSAVATVTQ
jgi:hypothetical protein